MYGELGSAQVEHLLHLGTVGHLGCYGDARPYVGPINYAYDGHHIYGYTREGMKLRLMRAHPTVCFQVDQPHCGSTRHARRSDRGTNDDRRF